ncbi:MAG: type II secretion system minor pseudopilin GspJ [Alphaproteobacteria bacterium]|nr:type II secretion system minor pseudopilin GspJ [Alphaproteobacteria bacterium]
MNRNAQRGFSLPELLVALLIFATLSSVAVYVLRLSIDARDQIGAADARLSAMETARAIMQDDLAQVAMRPVRDAFGASMGPAFQGGDALANNASADETPLMAFVRRGWKNPGWAAPRSSLQYVEYVVTDNTLVRRVRPYLDDARGQPATNRVLFSDVMDVDAVFLLGETSGRLEWVQLWPVDGGETSIPRAVEITMETERYGALRQLFWIGDIQNGGRDNG